MLVPLAEAVFYSRLNPENIFSSTKFKVKKPVPQVRLSPMIISCWFPCMLWEDNLLSDTIHIVISKLVSIAIALQQGIDMY